MYAIVEVGGKQVQVKKGDVVLVEKQDAEKGKQVSLPQVLLVSGDGTFEVGKPYISGASVLATVMNQERGEKLIAFKYRRRKNSKTTKGHRQYLTRLKIEEIKL